MLGSSCSRPAQSCSLAPPTPALSTMVVAVEAVQKLKKKCKLWASPSRKKWDGRLKLVGDATLKNIAI